MRHYLGVLWRRRWLVGVPLVLLPLITYVSSRYQQKVYQASASVLLNHQDQVASGLIGVQTPVEDPGRYAVTQAELATTPTLARRVLVVAGLAERSSKDLLDHTQVYSNADVLIFSVRDHDAGTAAELASAYARQYTAYRRRLDTQELSRTLGQLESGIAALGQAGGASKQLYASLAAKAEEIRLIEALRQSNVYVIRTSTAGDADLIAPRPLKNTAVAAAVGLMLGLVLAFLVDALDTRVRSADELEESIGLPLLARVPRPSSRAGRAGALAMLGETETNGSEAFLTLRTKLALANLELGGRTILVASACEDEGASTVAGNLAVALARTGSRVLLVDLDLRDPGLTRLFALEDRPGFTNVALGEATLDAALTPVSLEAGVGTPAGERPGGRLDVLGSGPLPPRPGEFVGSRAAAEILRESRTRGDLVLVAAPPLLSVGDSLALASSADALVLVSRLGVVRRPMLRELRRVLDTWPAAKLGLVLVEPNRGEAARRGPGGRLRDRWTRGGRKRPSPAAALQARSDRAAESWR